MIGNLKKLKPKLSALVEYQDWFGPTQIRLQIDAIRRGIFALRDDFSFLYWVWHMYYTKIVISWAINTTLYLLYLDSDI